MKRLLRWMKAHRVLAGLGAFLILWALVTVAMSWTPLKRQTSLVSDGGFAVSSAPGAAQEEMAFDADQAASSRKAEIGIAPPQPPFEPTAGETAADVAQRIIKTGTMRVVVEKVEGAVDDLTGYAEGIGGFVENSSVSESRTGRRSGFVAIRVPVDRFEEAVAHVRDIADLVREESLQGQDVTEQYTDLEARLRNARAQEEAYLTILQRATDVEDILAVQRELGNIRSQIEVFEGRLQYLENRTAFSTLTVYLEEEGEIQVPTTRFRPAAAVQQAVQALINAFQGVVISLIWTVILGLGLGIPAAVVIWLVYKLVRRLMRKRK